MFEQLQDRLARALKNIKGQGKISEVNIEDAMRDVRRALLEADVNFKVARDFVKQVKEKELLIAYLNFFKKYPNIKKYIQLVNKKVQLKNTKIYKFAPTKGIWFDQINFEKGNEKQEIKFN